MESKKQQNANFISALESFNQAWKELAECWQDHSIGDTDYPFSKSFDDLQLDVAMWVQTTKNEINKSILLLSKKPIINPEITIERDFHSRLRTNYSVEYVMGDIQFSGSVTEDASGNQSFEPNWFIDKKSESHWDENWEAIEIEILNAIP